MKIIPALMVCASMLLLSCNINIFTWRGKLVYVCMMIVGIILLLTGCTTTRTIEVPVPVPCSKPNIPVPHDYMADLNKNAGAKQFVPACLATREEYKNAYEACAFYQNK
jgi:hypothetical protein